MIVREIEKERDKVLSNFDWFNDYDDTRRFAERRGLTETVELLDQGFQSFLKRNQSIRKNNTMHKHHVELDTLISEYQRENPDKLMAETSITDLFMWSMRKDKGGPPANKEESEEEKSITLLRLREGIDACHQSAMGAMKKAHHNEAYNYLHRARCFQVVANYLEHNR